MLFQPPKKQNNILKVYPCLLCQKELIYNAFDSEMSLWLLGMS